jgi:alkylation response protein AidB-like acyl-CoA dehydrogenase
MACHGGLGFGPVRSGVVVKKLAAGSPRADTTVAMERIDGRNARTAGLVTEARRFFL